MGMNTSQLLHYAADHHIGLLADGDRIKVCGNRAAVNDWFLADLKTHKQAVLQQLKAGQPAAAPTHLPQAYRLKPRPGGSADGRIIADGYLDAVQSLLATHREWLDVADLIDRLQEREAILTAEPDCSDALADCLAALDLLTAYRGKHLE